MKNSFTSKTILVISLFISCSAAFAVDLDPWGNRRKAGEFRGQRDDLRQQLGERNGVLTERRAESARATQALNARRDVILALKQKVRDGVDEQGRKVTALVEGQTSQVKQIEAMLITAKQTQAQIQLAQMSVLNVYAGFESAKTLAPLFRNTSAMRELWLNALSKLERSENLTAEHRSSIARLKEVIANSDKWFWQTAPSNLMIDFAATGKSFTSVMSKQLLQDLAAGAAGLVAGLDRQFKTAQTIATSLGDLEANNQAMRKALE